MIYNLLITIFEGGKLAMKNTYVPLIGLLMLIIIYAGCSYQQTEHSHNTKTNPFIYKSGSITDIYTGTAPEVFLHNELSGNVKLNYTLNLGTSSKSVYFVFTNTNSDGSSLNPYINGNEVLGSGTSNGSSVLSNISNYNALPIGIRGKPEIAEFNRNPPLNNKVTANNNLLNKSLAAPLPISDTVGNIKNFYYDSISNIIPAMCRGVYTSGGKTLNVWVANNCWTVGGTKAELVDQTMVDALGQIFLTNATNIYSLVTNIYGPEWGAYADNFPAQLVSSADANNNITILLYDIDNDNSTNGGTVGFFWAKDNFLTSSISYSNQRIMFYIDAVMYATPGNPPNLAASWSSNDYWPGEIYSTLAHEFQHMIQFYQKSVHYNIEGAETWLNEMCSMATEDFVADKLGVMGPRGVGSGDYTAGSPGNTNGRLPYFNAFDDTSVTNWLEDSVYNTLKSYAVNYAFGAYLARNFGGVNLFRQIVDGSGTDYNAIVNAVNAVNGTSESFSTLLEKWGASALLSDETSGLPAGGFQYNRGAAISSTAGSITYNLGSINLFNYNPQPTINTTALINNGAYGSATMNGTSNRFYLAGTNLTGIRTFSIQIPAGVTMSVVVK